MKKTNQKISLCLIFFFMLTLMPKFGINVKAEEALKNPIINDNGTVTFKYQGDGTQTKVAVRGVFSNWENKELAKGESNIWSYTTEEAVKPGIFEYGFATWPAENQNEGNWQYDPLNQIRKNGKDGNPLLIINPIINTDNSITLNYAGDGTETKVIVKGSFNGWKAVELTKDPNNFIWSIKLDIEPGNYEYGFAVWTPKTTDNINGDWKSDAFNPNHKDATDKMSNAILTVPQLSIAPDKLVDQPGAKNKWVVAGSFQNWNKDSTDTQLKHLVGGFYEYSTVLDKGKHEFKIVKNGDWNSSFNNKGNNFILDLAEKAKVNFYVNEDLNEARINVAGVEGLKQYTPTLDSVKWPRLVGSIQKVFNEGEWKPEEAKQFFADYNFDGSIYKLQRTIPVGKYEAKVTFGANWDENYGATGRDSSNLSVAVLDPADVTFTIDYKGEKKLSHDYKPADGKFDGQIKRDKLEFDSRSITYKKPFGAIKEKSEDLTLRIGTEKDDVQIAKVELINGKGSASSYDMRKATSIGEKEYFEVTIPKDKFDEIGIWGYKFILIDGSTKVEYGDAGISGGTGAAADDGALPYNLTVYSKDYKTPDWMKGAVVYQIFPDRFFDGNKENNRAKVVDGYRGHLDSSGNPVSDELQYYDGGVSNDPSKNNVWGTWNDYPENPRQSTPENKPYYPNAKTDNIWTNEFYGGDIQGIEQKLDYIKSLGVTAIYLNPAAWAASNHKYDATDYKHLDPMFGQPVYNKLGDPTSGLDYEATRAASDRVYIAFAKAARTKGIKLIADGVFNHVGDDSIYFDRYEKYPEIGAYEYWKKVWDKVNEGKSQTDAEKEVREYFTNETNSVTGKNYKYPEDFEFTTWFTVKNEKNTDGTYKYEGWWGYDSLPAVDAKAPLADDELAVSGQHEWNNVNYRDNVIGHNLNEMTDEKAQEEIRNSNSQRWMWMGARGWRLDVAPDVSAETWKKFREAVKSTTGRLDANNEKIDDPVILGEEWGVATHYLLGDQFDSVMNYQFRNAIQNFMINGNAKNFNEALEVIRENYPKEAWDVMLNLVDSHDTVRNLTKIDNPTWEEENTKIAPEASDKALKLQALTAIFQMGYPGAPTIYYGDEVGVTGTKDPDSRRTFPWERVKETNGSYAATGRFTDLFSVYQKAGNLRNEYEDLFAAGDMKSAYADENVIAYARKSTEKGGIVAINRGDEAKTIDADVSGFLPDGITLKDKLYGNVKSTVNGGKVRLTIPAQSGLMMVSEEKLSTVPVVINLKAEASNGKVELSWNAAEGAKSYKVYRTNLEGQSLALINTSADTNYTDTTVVNGNRYYYYVTAISDGGESNLSEVVTALPAFDISSVSLVNNIGDVIVGLGKTTEEVKVEISIPGLTDAASYIGKEVPNVTARLVYYKDRADKAYASEAKLRYREDSQDCKKKIYYATFEPIEAGNYHYFAKLSTNNGESFKYSSENTMTALIDTSDTTAPKSPILSDITVESNRVELNWSLDDNDSEGFEVYRKTEDGEYQRIAALAKNTSTYVDYTVSNDTKYTYKIAAFDKAYNRGFSQEKSVTPKLVMVDVTLRLHIPSYTPTTEDIFIAGDFNGWNQSGGKLTVPSGATSRDVVEYSFKMMAGKAIQYKYTRGTWATEAFTSHARKANDTEDYGNWAYSSTDTNMKLTVKNQGGNKMVIDDYVLRWVDMPMIITMPRISYGTDINYTTDEDHFTLKGKVPYGVAFTINDEDISKFDKNAVNQYGDVYVENIQLKEGINKFKLHIEPTKETLEQPWYTDKGRASQATKTINMTITRNVASVAVEKVELDKNTLQINVGDSVQLKAIVKPDNATNKKVKWSSSNEKAVTVDENGNIKAVAEGTVEITATTEDGSKTAKCVITVKKVNSQDPGNGGNEQSGGDTDNGNTDKPIVVENKDTSAVVDAIKKADKNAMIIVEVGANKQAAKVIFDAIKGTGKTVVFKQDGIEWTFKGSDITGNTKTIDLTVNSSSLENSTSPNKEEIAEKVKDTDVYVISFANNGKLPGKAKVKVKLDENWLKDKNKDNIFVYYYNETTKKVEAIAKALKVDKDGYVEFEITHNSDYFIADKDLVSSGILPKTGAVVDLSTLLVIGSLILLAGVILIGMDKRRKRIK